MDLREFLSTLVPVGDQILLARPDVWTASDGKVIKGFRHTVFSSHAEAAEAAKLISAAGHNTYFALASYKQGFHTNAKGKRVVRVRENVQALQALWLDIDFKQGYAGPAEVVAALRHLSDFAKFPAPAILVGTGNGLHAYWPLSTPLPPDRWQRLAEALKEACKAAEVHADHMLTADSCRVLRCPETLNVKDPTNPKPVRILHSRPETFDPIALEGILAPWAGTKRRSPLPSARQPVGANSDLSGGLGPAALPSANFSEITKHCGVSKWILDTKGERCTEPEWVAALQLLKHCDDGEHFVHEVSKGHSGYSEANTDTKWIQRLANSAGPTVCKTFATFRSDICARCPHNGFVKSPIQLGIEGIEDLQNLPPGWRVAPDGDGIERLTVTDPAANLREWVPALRHVFSNFRPVRSVNTQEHDMMFDVTLKGADVWTVTLPMGVLGNSRRLSEDMAGLGVPLKEKEIKAFGDLMSTWLKRLQQARRVADVSEQLGWIKRDEELVGFACGSTIFYGDGRERNDIRPAREFATIAKYYEPAGSLEEWKVVANFIAKQNNPALTSVLAASFGAPLLKFLGVQGGTLSLVSSASGVGKSSTLKAAQAVWGSPVQAMNSVDDTPKSVARKMGFISNLPSFWDELRGKHTVDGFANLAFMLTQGRDKSRLDSNSTLRESHSWEMLLVAASNESIFDAMARRTQGTDAGMVRVFEIMMDKHPVAEISAARITVMFESLNQNYGHAGRVYAKYIAENQAEIRDMVQKLFISVGDTMAPQERFWYTIVAVILVGAMLAKKLRLVDFDLTSIKEFLLENLENLKERTQTGISEGGANEVLADYLRERGDRTMIVSHFLQGAGRPTPDNEPIIKVAPRSDKCVVVRSQKDRAVRFPTRDFVEFLKSRGVDSYGQLKAIEQSLGGKKSRCVIGAGTDYAGPRTWVMEVPINPGELED